MPSKSVKQANLMRAVAHGWKPDQMKGPSKKVAKDFVKADQAEEKAEGKMDSPREEMREYTKGKRRG